MQQLLILLVEDHPINQMIATNLLQKGGHKVVLARDGRTTFTAWLGVDDSAGPWSYIVTDVAENTSGRAVVALPSL